MEFSKSFLEWKKQNSHENKKIKCLVAPLNWGLGHASRMILVIQELINKGFEVIIAADKSPLKLLKKEFPHLKTIKLEGAEINYSKRNSQLFSILKFLPRFAFSIKKEHQKLSQIIENHNIKLIISDNRYGLWNKNIYSILVTHQLKLKLPYILSFAENSSQKLIYKLTKNFNEIWIPDFEGKENLSGELSHFKAFLHKKTYFIGILSKFLLPKFQLTSNNERIKNNKILVILSGVEPQRSILEKILIKQLESNSYKATIVLGKANYKPKTKENSTIKFISFAKSTELFGLINEAEIIICRAGYSSIMDMAALNKKALIIPTPGQTEQEYLSDYLKDKPLFHSVKQNEINLKKDLHKFIV